jgi:P-loop Domain of unknown function (DUF2791)
MAVMLKEWLELIDKEYLRDFIVNGGAAVKFLIADDASIGALNAGLIDQAAAHGLVFTSVSSADVKLHMIQDVFFAVSRQITWEADAQRFVEGLFQRQGYQWPSPGEPVALSEIAETNKVDATILRREFNTWLTTHLMKDTSMAQDFRIAVMQLCLNRLAPAGHGGEEIAPILQWLRGELRLLSPLKSANIYSRITRYNARAMLRSLCRWIALADHKGLLLAIDIRQLMRTASVVAEGMRYTSGAVMDAYEVLRQLVDDVDLFERLFVAVFADRAFIGDDRKRSVDAYTALKMRIWDDVRARAQDNPLAPMVIIEPNAKAEGGIDQ